MSSGEARARVAAIAASQGGVVSRRQVVALGLSDDWLRARVSAGQWQRVSAGVYCTFTGPLEWATRVSAAVAAYGSHAVLGDETALRLWGLRRHAEETRTVVVVDHTRKIRRQPGLLVRRMTHLDEHVHPVGSPPRLRLETALLRVAARRRSDDLAIGDLADACQQRLTTPRHLRVALDTLPRLPRRRMLRDLLDDVAAGAYSFLEVCYLRRVERPHGLPTGSRQRRVSLGRRVWFRDVEYVGLSTVVELDGRLGHESYDDRAADMDRDNITTRQRRSTYRLGYRHVFAHPCQTAALVAGALRESGWTGRPHPCGPGCILVRGTSSVP